MWKSAENMWLTQITKTSCVYGNLDVKQGPARVGFRSSRSEK